MYDTSRSLDIITDSHDTAMHKAVRKVLGGADKIVGVQMPYTPRCLRFTQDVKRRRAENVHVQRHALLPQGESLALYCSPLARPRRPAEPCRLY